MTGKLVNIYISKKKGDDAQPISQASLDEKRGLIGDYKSESGDKNRQISILLNNDREDIDKNYKNKGLCIKRFQENTTIEGFVLSELSADTRLRIGESKIEITSVGKECFKECELVKSKELCPLKEGVLFGKVIESGTIKVGDTIVKEKNI